MKITYVIATLAFSVVLNGCLLFRGDTDAEKLCPALTTPKYAVGGAVNCDGDGTLALNIPTESGDISVDVKCETSKGKTYYCEPIKGSECADSCAPYGAKLITSKAVECRDAPALPKRSMFQLRDNIENNLTGCWGDRSTSCASAAEDLDEFCHRLSQGEQYAREFPSGYCDGLAQALVSTSQVLSNIPPKCLHPKRLHECDQIENDPTAKSLCANTAAYCVDSSHQISALKARAKEKAGVVAFNFTPPASASN